MGRRRNIKTTMGLNIDINKIKNLEVKINHIFYDLMYINYYKK